MARVEFDHIYKVYANGFTAMKDLCLTIEDGEFMVFVGPSGCGKSTALRMLAGLEEISAGKLIIGQDVVNNKSPQDRNIAMVFQNYALYPHMTVRQNMEFPLRMMKVSKGERQQRVMEAAEKLGLTHLLDNKPKQMSGGQRQRVAMGRAIVRDPAVFLMDEPLSNLDAKMRVQIRTEIADLQRKMGTTTVYVTHDQVEAMTMGDRVAVMRLGELQQVAPPQELYDRPTNVFVAGFMGSPAMNIFHSELRKTENGQFVITYGAQYLAIAPETCDRYREIEHYINKPIFAGLRPEAFLIADRNTQESHKIEVEVTTLESLGHETIIYFNSPLAKIEIQDKDDLAKVLEKPTGESQSIAVARVGSAQKLHHADCLSLAVDTRQLYLFDRHGNAIL
ncbi:ABC transporter ATP-binding protein [Laspinema sp. A4]|uniref:ABC transporter ATP-binding protein n=1 Tax=Laspinema sp. D2d TaxID=2953686 RepID=UPI0021BA3C4E|nr:ABC transporter ATP-binding protein [Laspinema sp. D2d]MCT7986667.1 ABC transporter ATP-binding protein [Laspinema sp. D2d]